MRPLRTRLLEARKRLGIPWEVLERDYLLSWILAGISDVESLRDTLVFKGGTALKKCYFGDYRFSEDLDFSARGEVPRGANMERAIQEAWVQAARLLDEYALWSSCANGLPKGRRILGVRRPLWFAPACLGRGSRPRA